MSANAKLIEGKKMTEERKQELRQLLEEARQSLVIRSRSENRSSLPAEVSVEVYRAYLQQSSSSYYRSVSLDYRLDVRSEVTKSKLLHFIRVEFASFISDDRILSATLFLVGGLPGGFPLEDLLEQLLKIAIMRGIDQAVLNFDRSTTERHGSFQYMTLLEGIKLNKEIQVFDGIRLVPLPNSTSEFPRYLPDLSFHYSGMSQRFLFGKIVLIIDYSISPIFHKPFLSTTIQEYEEQEERAFHVEINSRDVRSFNQTDFPVELFCQALSFACNSGVQSALQWKFLARDELFNLSSGFGTSTASIPGPFGNSVEAGEDQINEAKHLYKKLINLDSGVKEKLRIPIDRWTKSKAGRDPVDQMIDLGIALEALYVTRENRKGKQLRRRASCYLGENAAHREALETEFEAIYDYRSDIVHNRELKEEIPVGEQSVPVSDFIERTQELCRESIMKVLENEELPDWFT